MDIELKNISRTLGGRLILTDVNARFAPGAVNVIIGPNGAGKTTLMRIAALLSPTDGGEVLADKIPIHNLPERKKTALRRRMGFVFQNPLLLDGPVLLNLLHGPRLRGMDPPKSRTEEVLAQVGLTGRENHTAKKLSGGEKQRLQMARLLLMQPEICFLDEPTANLDPLSVRTIEEHIAEICRSGATVILSTHNLAQARLLGQRFFFMKEGRMIHQGDPVHFFHQPACLDIAEFAAADNIIYGDLQSGDDGSWLQVNGLRILTASAQVPGKAAGVIRAEDIILSVNRLESSARNCFQGVITAIGDMGVIHSVSVTVAGQKFISVITRESAQLMRIQLNQPIWICFKSTAVHVLKY